MSELKTQSRQVVVPGETLATGLDYLPGNGAYRDGEIIRSGLLGITSVAGQLVKVIPLGGRYIPMEGDIVIGIVDEVRFSNWSVEINSPYKAQLKVADASNRFIDTRRSDMTDFFDLDETVIAQVIGVDNNMNINISLRGPGLMKIKDGKIILVNPAKVPRMIGKNGSMVRLIKEGTGCNITVAQNGRIWIKGPNKDKENRAIKAIKLIEDEAHTAGLTERVREHLGMPKEKTGGA